MSTDNMNIELSNSNLEEKVKDLIASVNKTEVRELINAYYSLRAQQLINDKTYDKIESLEGLVDLYNALSDIG